MFIEQLVLRRKPNGPPGSWEPPLAQSPPIDAAINAWVDQTGNEIVSMTTPGMFMQWMDAARTERLVVVTVMVSYIPAIQQPKPIQESNDGKPHISGWEPVIK